MGALQSQLFKILLGPNRFPAVPTTDLKVRHVLSPVCFATTPEQFILMRDR
jgi:hypothetical protein